MANTSAKFWKQPVFFLAALGMLFAFLVHYLEIQTIHLSDHLHETADDASYLRPAENLIDSGVWKDNSIGPSSYVQRPPLVGIVHFIGMIIFQTRSVWFLFITALLIHGIATGLLYKLLLHFSTKKNALFFTCVFILSPCFWGFLSYSISEAFVVSTVIIASYACLIPHRRQFLRLLLVLTLLYLLRPVLVLLFIPGLLSLTYQFIRSKEKINLLSPEALFLKCSLALSLGSLVFWEVRKINYTGSLSPHPIYHAQNETIFREPHQQLTELFKIWEVQPEAFHSITGRKWTFSLSDQNEMKRYVEAKSVPFKAETLLLLLVQFGHCNAAEYRPMSFYSRGESEHRFGQEIEKLRKKTISENRFQYWIKTPALSARENLFKSHLNLTLFQETFRGNPAMEFFRIASLALILMGYLSLIILPWVMRNRSILLFCCGSWIYFLFLTGYQRMNEDRYFLPLVVTGFICTVILTFRISEHFRKRVN